MNIDELDTGYFEPGSDADAIFTEASEKLHAMLKGEIKETITGMSRQRKRFAVWRGKSPASERRKHILNNR